VHAMRNAFETWWEVHAMSALDCRHGLEGGCQRRRELQENIKSWLFYIVVKMTVLTFVRNWIWKYTQRTSQFYNHDTTYDIK